MGKRNVVMFRFRDPPYIHTDEIADLLNRAESHIGCGSGWTTRKAKRWLVRANAAVKVPGLRSVVTTREKLRDAFPDIWSSILRVLS